MNQSNQQANILERAIAAVRKSTGVRISAAARQQQNSAADYKLKVRPPETSAQNSRFDFSAQVRNRLTQSALGELFVKAKRSTQKSLLVAEYIAPAEADRLRELGIAFFDAAGNAYFNEPGLYVFVNTNKNHHAVERRAAQKRDRLFEKSAPLVLRPSELKIVFALLVNSRLESADYRTIAEQARVALGSVGWLMRKLLENKFLVDEGSKKERRLIEKPELLKLWVEGYLERLRPKQLLARFEATAATGKWWEGVDLQTDKAVWGGEIAGAHLTGYLKPQTVTIYADSVLPRLQARYGLRRRADGDVEILQKFWADEPNDKATAPPLVVYADLLAGGDERNLEAARRIYERHLARLIGETA